MIASLSNVGSGRFVPTRMIGAALMLSLSLLVGGQVAGAPAPTRGSPSGTGPSAGTVLVKAASVPFSRFGSPQAEQAFTALLAQPPQMNLALDATTQRRIQSQFTDKLLVEVERRYHASATVEEMGGVRTDVIVPADGVAPRNRHRILISLHSGGFLWGAGSEALLEAIPIAVTGRIEVVSVDYRMAPEHRFPAASEDVAAVYQALLKRYRPQDIGIYGISAGGILAAQSAAWFAAHHLPEPGGIASLCGTGAEIQGDSAYLAGVLVGMSPVPPGGKPLLLAQLPYFKGVSDQDPLAYPVDSPQFLRQFPPTLLLVGSRDFTASSETLMQRRLWEAGADSQLFIFDGLWHAFMMHPDLPESREAYGILWRFFDGHLGHAPVSANAP